MKVFVIILGLFIVGCSSYEIIPIGPNEYMLEKSGEGPLVTGAEISAELQREARAFCSKTNKIYMLISVAEQNNQAAVRPASSKIKFHCIVYKE